MQQITEQMIAALAPNAAAAANGRKISQKGGFIRLEHSADDTFYLGECSGSGKNNYITTIDFIDPIQPVFRCTCPSRQFPCKHSLALLHEQLADKAFSLCEIPADILDKRTKKQARTEKVEAATQSQDPLTPTPPPKVNKAARSKKLQKQLQGLALTSQLISELLHTGLGAMGATSLERYRQLSKQLGDYYLPGPQILLSRLILEIEAFSRDGLDSHYESAVQILLRLQALTKKSRQYLSAKLDSGDVSQEDNLLYEELGGAWKLSELLSLGLSKEHARLVQLGFWVTLDQARSEYIDTGCWVDLDTGELHLTQNYRPLKALKYIKQEDTLFDVANIPCLCYYPGDGNRRVRWDGMLLSPFTEDVGTTLHSHARLLAPIVKESKNTLKNTLANSTYFALIRYSSIGHTSVGPVLLDETGSSIRLKDAPELEPSVFRLEMLSNPTLFNNQVLLGGLCYDISTASLTVQPISILTATEVIRLLY